MQQYKESHHAYFLGILARFLDFSHPYDDKSSLSGQIAFSLSAMAAKQARENPVCFQSAAFFTTLTFARQVQEISDR